MSGIDVRSRLRTGQVMSYPTKNFALAVLSFLHHGQELAHVASSPRRRGCRTISSSSWSEEEGRRMASEDSRTRGRIRAFPAGCPHLTRCHCIAVVEDPPGFPAYSRLRTARSPVRGAAPRACLGDSYLRTVIVTAAVYRRLGSELRWDPE